MQLNPTAIFLKDSPRLGMPGDRPDTDETAREKQAEDHGAILCKNCGRVITHAEDRFTVHGSNRHTFANPHGRVYEIGCFQTAPGCAYGGALTAEFSWFAGYQWKIALCGGCLTHLGWLFVSSSNRFNGLILERLVSRIQ